MHLGLDSSTELRTHLCGVLNSDFLGQRVSVCGWVAKRREHSEHLVFIDLRDHSGIVQCVIDGSNDARAEYVLRVTGTVTARKEGTANAALATGEVELKECEVEVLSAAEPPPFPLDERHEADENVRLRYRYLDLRRSQMQRNLRARAAANGAIRQAMDAQGFVEIETPMLIASTPEGARDFVVPSRLKQGTFYALPQSPQLFKQLAMVGGMDRYYQIARCLRDEDLRSDRQFEFTQLDAEMSFASQSDVLRAISHTVAAVVERVTGTMLGEIPTMTWHEAQERFGSDKPDTRFGLELIEMTPVFASTDFNAFKAPSVKGICVPGGASMTRSRLDDLTALVKRWGAKGLVWMRVKDGGELESPVAKFLSEQELADLVAVSAARPGDLLMIVADELRKTRHICGLLRLELGRPPVDEGGLQMLWVVDFPLFEAIDEHGHPVSAHHPFTMPHTEDVHVLDEVLAGGASEALLEVRSQAYDLVLNGWELGSGSVRIHRPEIQRMVFQLLGIDDQTAQSKFGFLLDAFRFGAPPHAGFAFGVDRLVALLLQEENIREVIAFPKTQSGGDPLTNAPVPISEAQLRELGLRVLPPIEG